MDAFSILPEADRADHQAVNGNAEPLQEATAARDVGNDQTETRGRLKELKREIALNRYDVDSGAVADAILSKLRLVRQGRMALTVSAADRSPSGPSRHPSR